LHFFVAALMKSDWRVEHIFQSTKVRPNNFSEVQIPGWFQLVKDIFQLNLRGSVWEGKPKKLPNPAS